jgi:hypothetical protein
MQAFVDACQSGPAHARLERTLHAIVRNPALHARFLNSLSRLEYVGVRKMLKTRRAQDLDLDGLQHMLEEAAHATRLKKFACSVAPAGVSVATFGAEHTLAGDEAERYFQTVDRAGEQTLGAATLDASSPEAAYALTSAAIEIRARTFYPAYQQVLQATAQRVSVASILSDEEAHLREMQARLQTDLPDWQDRLQQVMQIEERAFASLLDALDAAVERAA